MANTGFKGLDVRQTGNQLVFRAFLSTAGAVLTSGTTTVELYELQSDGTLSSYDFSSNTFKTTALTTATGSMTHRTGNNSTTNTGIWTYSLSTLTGFTAGSIYLAVVRNSGADTPVQVREFQYGSDQGDLVVTANGTGVGELNVDARMWLGTTIVTPGTAGTPDVNAKQLFGALNIPASAFEYRCYGMLSGRFLGLSGTSAAAAGSQMSLDNSIFSYNGAPVFIGPGPYRLWLDSTNSRWVVSTNYGSATGAYWTLAGVNTCVGSYTAQGTATGTLTVTNWGWPVSSNFGAMVVNSSGNVGADTQSVLGTAVTAATAGVQDVNAKYHGGTSQTGRDIGANVLLSPGTGTGQISLSSGAVTVGTNNDKTGYSLSQSFPANFSSLAITVGGAVTAGTVSDKTGYSLSQSFPANFSSLSIDGSGRVLLQPSQTGVTIPTVTSVGSVSGSVGSVTGSVGSISGVTFPTNFSTLLITSGGHIQYADTVTTYTGNTPQTGDSYLIVNSGSYGNSQLLTAIQNIQNATFIVTSIPQELMIPASGSTTIQISVVFYDETGAAKNLDSGNPTLTLVNDAGTDKSGRLGTWSNPATGKYSINYTNTSSDAIEGLHWDLSGTINSKLRRTVAYTQILANATTSFSTSDRTTLNNIAAVIPAYAPLVDSSGGVTLSAKSHTGAVIPTVTTTTTATNLTNAPTAGDFTAAMKTSLNSATPASVTGAVGSVTANVNTNANSTETAIKAKTDLIATNSADSPNAITAQTTIAGIPGNITSGTSTVTTAISALPTTTTVNAIKAKTDNIGTNSMDSSNSATANSNVATITAKLPTNNIADETLVLAAINALPTSVPTAVQIRQEMDSSSTKLAAAATSANVTTSTNTIVAAIGGLGSGQIVLNSPLSADGGTLTITQGDDLYSADYTAAMWTIPGTFPSLTSATAVLRLSVGGASATVSGVSLAIVTGGITATAQIPNATSTALLQGTGIFQVAVTWADGHSYTYVQGTLVVNQKAA